MQSIILIYFIFINIISFFTIYTDKQNAKCHLWRIPELTLFLISILGGSIGTYLGMYVFNHKTRKIKFKIGIPIIFIIQVWFIITFDFSKVVNILFSL